MIYIDDCLDATVQVMETSPSNLTMRTYNIQAVSFTPEMLVNEMKAYYPHMEVEYVPDATRQKIGESSHRERE